MTGRCNIQNALLFLACLRTWELSLTLGTMLVTVLSPPDREQKAGSDEFHLSLLLPRGRGSLAASLCTAAMGKPAYWLCQLLHSLAGWNTSFVCVPQLHQSPDVSPGVPSIAITTETPPVVAREGAQGGGHHWHEKHPAAPQPTACTHSPSGRSQGRWAPDYNRTHIHKAVPCHRRGEVTPIAFFHPYLVVYMFPGNLSSSFQASHNLYHNGSFQRSFQSNDLCRFSLQYWNSVRCQWLSPSQSTCKRN